MAENQLVGRQCDTERRLISAGRRRRVIVSIAVGILSGEAHSSVRFCSDREQNYASDAERWGPRMNPINRKTMETNLMQSRRHSRIRATQEIASIEAKASKKKSSV